MRSTSMVVNVFPVAVGVPYPESGVGGISRDRLTGDRVDILYRADVGDARRVSFVVEDVNARIDNVDVALMAS